MYWRKLSYAERGERILSGVPYSPSEAKGRLGRLGKAFGYLKQAAREIYPGRWDVMLGERSEHIVNKTARPLYLRLVIHEPELTIYNEEDSWKVRDLFWCISIDLINMYINTQISLIKTTFTKQEITSGYIHSHVNRLVLDESPFRLRRYCMGESTLGFLLTQFDRAPTLDTARLILYSARELIRWESKDGGPYIYIDSIGTSGYLRECEYEPIEVPPSCISNVCLVGDKIVVEIDEEDEALVQESDAWGNTCFKSGKYRYTEARRNPDMPEGTHFFNFRGKPFELRIIEDENPREQRTIVHPEYREWLQRQISRNSRLSRFATEVKRKLRQNQEEDQVSGYQGSSNDDSSQESVAQDNVHLPQNT